MQKKVLIRITTVPVSLKVLLKGQLEFMSNYFDILAISSNGPEFEHVLKCNDIRGVKIPMTRKISPFRDIFALVLLIFVFLKVRPYIVHTHTPKAGLLGMLAAYITRVTLRFHTFSGLSLMETNGIKKRILITTEKITYVCANKIYPN